MAEFAYCHLCKVRCEAVITSDAKTEKTELKYDTKFVTKTYQTPRCPTCKRPLFELMFLKAADLQGHRVPVVIADCRMEDMGGKDGFKPVLYFRGKERGMVMNVTNKNTLEDAWGEETDGWMGKQIILYSCKVQFEGQMRDGLRIEVPAAPKVQQPQRKAPVVQAEPLVEPGSIEDDVPADQIPF